MRNISFIFSGQGAQAPGMGKSLYDNSPAARAIFNMADKILNRDISELCFYGTQEELNLTHNTQPCMLAMDLAAYAAITEARIQPVAVAGFSLGEYAALVAGEVIRPEDAFRVIQIRADAMQEAVPLGQGAMAAVMKLDQREVDLLCREADGYVVPANFNAPGQIVVSGEAKAVDKLLALAKNRKIRALKLPVSAPFHCQLMEPARTVLEAVLPSVPFQDAVVPVYMNVDGAAHMEAVDIRECVLRQTTSPVQWADTIRHMFTEYGGDFVELGAGRALCSFVKRGCVAAGTVYVEDMETLNEALNYLRTT